MEVPGISGFHRPGLPILLGQLLMLTRLTPLFFLGVALALAVVYNTVDVISGQTSDGPSTVQFESASSGFDGPKVSNLNSTTFDLWYFDVVAYDLSASAVVAFYTADPGALFPQAVDVGSAAYAEVFITTPAGDLFIAVVPGDSLTVVTSGDGSSGMFDSGGAAWTGSSDMSQYTVTINASDQGITGEFTMTAIAPAHFPCASTNPMAGQSFELAPGLGWANAVPDADGQVNLVLNGEPLQFAGSGYHDKNWGSQPWDTTLNSWYWGHARLGAYSLVWFDFIEPNGSEGGSIYLSQNGVIVAASCSGSLVVRPTGGDDTFPPTTQTDLPDEFTISMDIPEQGTLQLQTSEGQVLVEVPGLSTRWSGQISGTLGGQQLSGIALYEQFTFAS